MFEKARPIWGKGLQEKKHINLGLYKSVLKAKNSAFIRIAVSGFYRLFVNGEFVNYGPVRCAHGHYRVDEIPLYDLLTEEKNHIAVEVVNYCIPSFAALNLPGFIEAEIVIDGKIVAATNEADSEFVFLRLNDRIQKTQLYSFQRTLTEGYRLSNNIYSWRVGVNLPESSVEMQETAHKSLLPRELPLNTFSSVSLEDWCFSGNMKYNEKKETDPFLFFNYRDGNTNVRGFAVEELEVKISDEICKMEFSSVEKQKTNGKNILLKANEYKIFSLPTERTGLIQMDFEIQEPSVLYILFDEILDKNNHVDPFRMTCINAMYFELEQGKYSFINAEPIGFKYVSFVLKEGSAQINNFSLREYVHPFDNIKKLDTNNADGLSVFEAGWQSFRQNASDVFMDCPTRERAGWLCDSFFIGRSAQFFTDNALMEKQFLENFIMRTPDEHLPHGMLAMCYPSEHYSGNYIVNWAMWYIVELYDYYKRTNDCETVKKARNLIYDLLEFLLRLENEDGLLCRLPAWAFVEWSHANNLVQDLNYPNNMVYSYVLRAVGRLYKDEDIYKKGEILKEVIRRRSYNGEFFTDNEVFVGGILRSTGEATETCQYHAFFFEIATPETYPDLWKKLTEEFGPKRHEKGLYPKIYPANAFTGNYMRLDILLRYGLYDLCFNETVEYFKDMAKRTGTLWEHMDETASCNHGFASYASFLLYYSKLRKTPDCFKSLL